MLRRIRTRKWAPIAVLAVLALAVIGVVFTQRESGAGGGLLGTAGATTYPLTVAIQGSGMIAGNPISPSNPIMCNYNGSYSGNCTANYPAGANVGLVETSLYPTFPFKNWAGCTTSSGTTCNVTMNGPQSVTAAFANTPPYISDIVIKAAPRWQDAMCSEGWNNAGDDLNKGAGGDWVSVCFKATINAAAGASVMREGLRAVRGWTEFPSCDSWGQSVKGGDLNSGAGGGWKIGLCVSKFVWPPETSSIIDNALDGIRVA
ncbi:MAG: hypothetical protein NTZ05_00525, partial [Chloroflexi bacterium]|nr:hypothetical protein [Chloroflexota bacterium]